MKNLHVLLLTIFVLSISSIVAAQGRSTLIGAEVGMTHSSTSTSVPSISDVPAIPTRPVFGLVVRSEMPRLALVGRFNRTATKIGATDNEIAVAFQEYGGWGLHVGLIRLTSKFDSRPGASTLVSSNWRAQGLAVGTRMEKKGHIRLAVDVEGQLLNIQSQRGFKLAGEKLRESKSSGLGLGMRDEFSARTELSSRFAVEMVYNLEVIRDFKGDPLSSGVVVRLTGRLVSRVLYTFK